MAVEAYVDGNPVIVANVPGSVPSSVQNSGATYIKGDPGPPGPPGPGGPAGQDGQDGSDGQDGFSPTITSTSITGGHRLTITDADSTKTVDVMDGQDGQDGRDGQDGQNGQDGTPAGFGTPSATVDSGTGTPGVTVTASGPDTAKVFSFAFTNLKGNTGPTGPQGPAGPDADAFTVALLSASWSSNAQTVSNAYFVASGYAYIVSPASESFADYGAAQIYADDVTTDGSMTFHCADEPTNNLTVNIVRVVAS